MAAATSSASSGTPLPPHNSASTPAVPAQTTYGLNIGFGANPDEPTTSAGAVLTTLTPFHHRVRHVHGTSEGVTARQAFPAPTNEKSGLYFICQVEGNSV